MSIISTDVALFHYLNHELRNSFFDVLLPYWRNPLTWVPLYLYLYYALWQNFGRKALIYLFALILTVGIADQTASQLLKKNIQRLRPCNAPTALLEPSVQLIPCGVGYSFPSAHATNHTAIAVLFLSFFQKKQRKKYYWLLFWAISIGYAQIYVGVHYPFDVLAGALLGALIAWGMSRLYAYAAKKWFNF